jgi:hypothetical protein
VNKIAMAWFSPESWRQLEAVSDAAVCGSYEEFLRHATEMVRAFEAEGIEVEKHFLDVPHMVAWCRRWGYRIDSKGRAAYGSALLAAGGDPAELDRRGFVDHTRPQQ